MRCSDLASSKSRQLDRKKFFADPVTVFAIIVVLAFLLLFIAAGYILSRWKFVPQNAQTVLSKLENTFFIPALVLGTFIDNFTVQTITVAWKLLLGSLALAMLAIGLSLLCVRFCSKDKYERNIYTYGLCFSN